MAKARAAQDEFEAFSQEQVDAIVKGIGKYVYDNGEMLARMAVDETGIGVYEDKILKNKGKARVIWNSLKDKKSRGIIDEDAATNLVFVAKPMGVVGAVTPVTNPIVTPMCNAMFALKAGNAVIFAPHPKAEKCTRHLTEAFREVVRANGGPEDLVQMVRNGSVVTTQELMKDVDVVVATGGRGDGEVGLLVRPAVVRRRRRQRAGDHRPRGRSRRRGGEDRRSLSPRPCSTSSSSPRPAIGTSIHLTGELFKAMAGSRHRPRPQQGRSGRRRPTSSAPWSQIDVRKSAAPRCRRSQARPSCGPWA